MARNLAIVRRGEPKWVKPALLGGVLLYLVVFLLLPLSVVLIEGLRKGVQVYWAAIADPITLSAVKLTLLAAGLAVPPEMAKDIAVSIRNPMWQWHINLGYALAGLLLARIIIALLVEKRSPFAEAIKAALGLRTVPAPEKGHALHYTVVKLGYAAFYLATMLMVATGLALAFKGALGLPESLLETAKEVHETAMWFFVVFGAGHILGVLVAENRQDPGLVSDMIHGGPPKS
jgi:cytochrome b561